MNDRDRVAALRIALEAAEYGYSEGWDGPGVRDALDALRAWLDEVRPAEVRPPLPLSEPSAPGRWRFTGAFWDLETGQSTHIKDRIFLIGQVEGKFYVTDEKTDLIYIPLLFTGFWTLIEVF